MTSNTSPSGCLRQPDRHGLDYARKRDDIVKKMTVEQVAEAQRLAREWKPKTWDQVQEMESTGQKAAIPPRKIRFEDLPKDSRPWWRRLF